MCHVLIIEDERLIALDIEDILTRQGATSFDMVDTEQDAIDAATSRRPDVITADVVLRAGSGPTAVEAILARYGPIPTLYITGTPDVCRPTATVRVLRKPVNETALTRAFQAMRPAA